MRHGLIGLAVVLGSVCQVGAQVNLTEAPLVDSCIRNELSLELKGKITVQQPDGKPREFPHEAQANHVFLERVLEAGTVPDKSARYYTAARADIIFNNQPSQRSLRPERQMLVTQRIKDQLVSYSIKGTLTREELELTEHFDTLSVPGLVPGKEVELGTSWKLPSAVVAALCDLEGLTTHTLQCTLEAVKDNRAHVKVAGNAEGISLGAQVALVVAGSFDFDVEAKRIVELEWKQSDQRQQGPVSPHLSADVVIRLKRTPIPEPVELSQFAVDPLKAYDTPPERLTNISWRDSKDRYTVQLPRDWHVVSPEGNNQLVLRLMDRGDFVAQATVTPWQVDAPATLQAFSAQMSKAPGWTVNDVTEETELKDIGEGQRVWRVTATGDLDGVSVVQSFYLLKPEQGDPVIVTFTMGPTQVANLKERDLILVRNFTIPAEK
jgi:hypothetical protein